MANACNFRTSLNIGATTSVLQEHDSCQVNSSCWKIGSFFFRAEWWTWSCFFDAKGKSVPKKYSPTLGGNFHGDESHEIESVKRSPSKQIQLDQEQGKIVPYTNGGVAKKKLSKPFPFCWKGYIHIGSQETIKTIVPSFGCLKFPTQTNWSLVKTC